MGRVFGSFMTKKIVDYMYLSKFLLIGVKSSINKKVIN